MEHRCGFRRIVNVPVRVRTRSGLASQATLCEVSLSGARLVCSLPLPMNSSVLVQFAVRRADSTVPKRVTLEAEVVRSTDTGFALEWLEFAPEAARALYAPQLDTPVESVPFPLPVRRAGG
jgi:hypothetical protein